MTLPVAQRCFFLNCCVNSNCFFRLKYFQFRPPTGRQVTRLVTPKQYSAASPAVSHFLETRIADPKAQIKYCIVIYFTPKNQFGKWHHNPNIRIRANSFQANESPCYWHGYRAYPLDRLTAESHERYTHRSPQDVP